MKKALIIVFLLKSVFALSQVTDTIYFDSKWKFIKLKEKASYYRVSSKINDTLYQVTDFFLNNKAQMTGYYTDPKTDLDEARNGSFIYYDSVGRITSEGSYIHGKKESEWKYYFEDGGKASIRLYANGMYEGKSVFFDSMTQKIIAEGNYYKNKKDAEWRYYYKDGKIESSRYYVSGLFDGLSVFYDSITGYKTLECNFYQGLKHGQWLLYYRNGNLKVKGNCTNGIENGAFQVYDSISRAELLTGDIGNGSGDVVAYYGGTDKILYKCSTEKSSGIKHFTYYDSSTRNIVKEIHVKNGVPVGEWKHYYKSGKLAGEENYSRGKLDGVFNTYDSLSDNKLTHGKYSEGKRVGKWEFYYSVTGKLMHEEKYKKGLLHGECVTYDTLGLVNAVYIYEQGKENGNCKMYYEGTKQEWINWHVKNDSLDGSLIVYYPDGKIKRREEYINGAIASAKCFDLLGNETEYYPVKANAKFESNIMTYIGDNLQYPESAKKEGIEGKTIVRFAVDWNGSISEVQVLEGFNKECDAEAVRLVSQMPPWIPAQIDGKPYRTYQTLPIVFWIH